MMLVAVFEYPYFEQVVAFCCKSYLFLDFPNGGFLYILTSTYMAGHGYIPKSGMGIFVFGALLNKYFPVFGIKPNMYTRVKNSLSVCL